MDNVIKAMASSSSTIVVAVAKKNKE